MSSSSGDCLFCNKTNCKVISSTKYFFIIRDTAYPVTKHHTLIITNRHVDDFFDLTKDEIFEKKNQTGKNGIKSEVKLIGLDKITAKTSEIKIKLGETKLFGPLEIKVLKCGKIESGNKDDHVAYLQVKDLSEDQSEQVFIFNGWIFASDPSLTPFDHAIYDLQLLNCNSA